METSDASAEEANQSEEELEIKIDEDENRKITTAGRSIKEPWWREKFYTMQREAAL